MPEEWYDTEPGPDAPTERPCNHPSPHSEPEINEEQLKGYRIITARSGFQGASHATVSPSLSARPLQEVASPSVSVATDPPSFQADPADFGGHFRTEAMTLMGTDGDFILYGNKDTGVRWLQQGPTRDRQREYLDAPIITETSGLLGHEFAKMIHIQGERQNFNEDEELVSDEYSGLKYPRVRRVDDDFVECPRDDHRWNDGVNWTLIHQQPNEDIFPAGSRGLMSRVRPLHQREEKSDFPTTVAETPVVPQEFTPPSDPSLLEMLRTIVDAQQAALLSNQDIFVRLLLKDEEKAPKMRDDAVQLRDEDVCSFFSPLTRIGINIFLTLYKSTVTPFEAKRTGKTVSVLSLAAACQESGSLIAALAADKKYFKINSVSGLVERLLSFKSGGNLLY